MIARALALVCLTCSPAMASARAIVEDAARRHQVPVGLALAVAKVESGFRCNARSRANARGVMQVLPATARGVGVHGNLFDCRTGAEAGMRYLAAIIRRHGISCASVSLYERGARARPRCTAYGRKVMSRVR
jgi:soluble lytic murein transglycosylase-like protein